MISTFDLFKIGVGPSSSHTVGPMRASREFAESLKAQGILAQITRIEIHLYGSLALTGKGHATDSAVILGLSGVRPETADPDLNLSILAKIQNEGMLSLNSIHAITFNESTDIIWHKTICLPLHPNGMRFAAYDVKETPLFIDTIYSVGGGFVVRECDWGVKVKDEIQPPYPFSSGAELLSIAEEQSFSIAELMRANERLLRTDGEINAQLDHLREVMEECIERGCGTEGILPGGLNVKRRAAKMYLRLSGTDASSDPLSQMDWVSLFALAVNEENAAGGRVVTAPTNGAAGIVPAVLTYYTKFYPSATDAGARDYLLTAAAIGMLYKRNASLSAAEMGCQGEVGVACSMAAAGLAAVMGGTNEQIENAAEIGMEHNLGLTCDPIGGLVQVPCIERNTMGAIKAINAARLAVLHGDGTHRVPLDKVIETMRQTGVDMQSKYKETSLGGLAVNMVNC